MKYTFIFVSIFVLLNCKEEDNEKITIEFSKGGIYSVGSEEGKFGLKASTIDQNDFFNKVDIEENTKFNFNITSSESTNIYPINCRLWKDDKKGLNLLCGLEISLIKVNFFNTKYH